MSRFAKIHRQTHETDIALQIDLDQTGGTINTGHGFIDHMLEQIIRHGRMYLEVKATGDLHVDVHHLAEDLGIVLGQALQQALGDKVGLERYADAFVPMDESLAHVVLDISGRPHISFEPVGFEGSCQGFNMHHLREFFRGFTNHAGVTLHVRVLAGIETHHVAEACVKAFARALHLACKVTSNDLPSTKGLL